jgi:hypothetical protein
VSVSWFDVACPQASSAGVKDSMVSKASGMDGRGGGFVGGMVTSHLISRLRSSVGRRMYACVAVWVGNERLDGWVR